MATVVRLLKDRDTGDKIYPVTNVNAVFNNDGDNLQELLDRAGRTFVVTLDGNLVADKTFTEIMTAYTAGKNIRVKYDDYDYIVQYESDNTSFYFTCTEGDDYCVRILHVNESNFWDYNQYSYQSILTFDYTPTANSNNPVVSKGIKSALDTKVSKVASTDNAIVRFDGTTGNVQNSSATVTDDGSVSVKNIIVHGSNNTNDTRIIKSDASNNIFASINGTTSLVVNDTEVRRGASASTINLGSSTYPWNNVYAKNFITNGGTQDQVVLGNGTLQNLSGLYASNIPIGTSANYIKEPEFKTVKINGSSTNAASTNNCVLQYDITNKCLNFVFN